MNQPYQFSMNLGAEGDAELIRRLRTAVVADGGIMREVSYAVAGSQEIIEYSISMPGGDLSVVSETNIGLSLSGPEHLVQALAHAANDA